MATTTNFGWETPDNTDAVTNGALAIRTLAGEIDSSVYGLAGTLGAWKSGSIQRTGNPSGSTKVSNTAHVLLVPFIIPNNVTLASVSVKVEAFNAGTGYLGVYSASATTNLPDALVASFGSFSSGSNGVKTISTTQALTAGLYWFALKPNNITATYTDVTSTNVAYQERATYPFASLVTSVANGFTFSINKWAALTYLQAASGALEATAGTYVSNADDLPMFVLAVA